MNFSAASGLACSSMLGFGRLPENNPGKIWEGISLLLGLWLQWHPVMFTRRYRFTRDKKVDFEQYQTYAWLPDAEHPADSICNDDLIRKNIRNYFTHCLTQRRLLPDTVKAQLLLRIEWLSHAREVTLPPIYDQPEFFDIGYYYAPALYVRDGKLTGKPGWHRDFTKPEKVRYVHGGAKLTAIDRKTNQLVWEGTAQGDLYDHKAM
ncbi:MAG: DUF4136 domain-containing protein, partial [Cyclobacteriaceae bacterium]